MVAVVGNPNPASRTLAVAELVARRVGQLAAIDDAPRMIDVVDSGPNLLRWGDPTVAELKAEVLGARALVVASPTYKAAYTGLLKLFLDQFDAGELHGIPTVALMTGGTARRPTTACGGRVAPRRTRRVCAPLPRRRDSRRAQVRSRRRRG